MPDFRIEETRMVTYIYEVEAPDEDVAMTLFHGGDAEYTSIDVGDELSTVCLEKDDTCRNGKPIHECECC